MPFYMKFGSIQGSVTVKEFSKWIAVENFFFGASRPSSSEPGKGAESRHKDLPAMSPITITRELDIASTALMRNCLGGTPTECHIVSVEAGEGDKPIVVLKIELQDVLLSNYSCTCLTDGGIESLDLNYNFIDIEYDHHDSEAKTKKERASFDVSEAKGG